MNYTNYDELPLVLSVREIAKVLDISLNIAYDLVRSGAIRSTKVGKQYRISKNALFDYLEK